VGRNRHLAKPVPDNNGLVTMVGALLGTAGANRRGINRKGDPKPVEFGKGGNRQKRKKKWAEVRREEEELETSARGFM